METNSRQRVTKSINFYCRDNETEAFFASEIQSHIVGLLQLWGTFDHMAFEEKEKACVGNWIGAISRPETDWTVLKSTASPVAVGG